MSYWNFRVCREQYHGDVGASLSIREVYYNTDGSIWAVSAEPIAAHGEMDEDLNESDAFKEVKADLQRMQECTKKSIINLDTIEFAEHEIDDD